MAERKWLFGLPVVLAFGVAALAIGLVPGVRNWLDSTFPQLGINGPSLETQRSSSVESERYQREVDATRMLPNPNLDLPSSQPHGTLTSHEDGKAFEPLTTPVQLAQATLPVEEPVLTRIAQNQAPNLPIPNNGLNVPSSAGNGSLLVSDAKVLFPEDIPIAAQTDGIIAELFVDEGSFVRKGDPMIIIDSRIAEAEAEVAKEELAAAVNKAEDNSSIEYARAAVEVAMSDVKISDQLYAKGAEGVMENEKKRLELKKAQLQVRVSQSEKAQQLNAVGVQTAKLNASKVQLALRKIPAPYDGFVSEIAKKKDSFAKGGEIVFRFTSMEKMRIRGLAKVLDAPHLLLNAPARVTIFVAPGKSETIDGKVFSVAPRQTGTSDQYMIFIDIPNRLTADGQYLFREGMKAAVDILPNR
ncbi:MAG: HlyD family efflux transporter periplasmic adaptor subunit [Planctomycetota bacterium]|nr:HlyD family efflux transporter periplasmic adaptor subunit [Planctomycetota bacterium]